MLGYAGTKRDRADHRFALRPAAPPAVWTRSYLRSVVIADIACAIAAALAAEQLRFNNHVTATYVAFSLMLPVAWPTALSLASGYDSRFIGVGSDEFRKVLNAGMGLTASIAIFSFAANLNLSRGYVVIALPGMTCLDLLARYALRKRLHKLRRRNRCMHRVIAVGHERAVEGLVNELRREPYHGLAVVAACVAERSGRSDVAGVPVSGGLENVADAVRGFGADTVAVLACPELDGVTLRALAWELEQTETDLYVAPALLDVSGPRTTIRPAAGMTLLHVEHPELGGLRLVLKDLFDRMFAALALIVMGPVLAVLAFTIRLGDGGPALFRQVRVGKDGRVFRIYKFRTMVVDAEQRRAEFATLNESDGLLFKVRKDPRITEIGAWLRRWSIDEIPQLINVLRGDMSLVGPRPALPDEAARYADHVRRRLVVKPGLTGLWQVNGRSDLSWEESVRLDLRYVENWSFVLDLQILWKTASAVRHGSGAY